jgi:hypothetical protein
VVSLPYQAIYAWHTWWRMLLILHKPSAALQLQGGSLVQLWQVHAIAALTEDISTAEAMVTDGEQLHRGLAVHGLDVASLLLKV